LPSIPSLQRIPAGGFFHALIARHATTNSTKGSTIQAKRFTNTTTGNYFYTLHYWHLHDKM
jgi:hypothetical protein